MKNTLSLIFCLLILGAANKAQSQCNWKNKISWFWAQDSCWNNNASLHAGILLNSTTCIKYSIYIDSSLKVANSSSYGSNNWASYYQQVFKNGSYSICFKLSDSCNKCDTTICKNVTVNCNFLSTNKAKIDKIRLFPNPTSGIINIQLNNFENVGITLNSIHGQTLLKMEPQNRSVSIDLSKYPSGTYLVGILSKNETQYYQVIKQ